jgi:hypothetical protein
MQYNCPVCESEIKLNGGEFGTEGGPHTHDLMLCYGCTAVLWWCEHGELHRLTEEEMQQLPKAVIVALALHKADLIRYKTAEIAAKN